MTAKSAKSWIFRFMIDGRARSIGLGSFSAVGLAEARAKAVECCRLRIDGLDPSIKPHRPGWQNPKHVDQWANTLATYAGPVFGKVPVEVVDTALALHALEAS